jgi:hypothetical protein
MATSALETHQTQAAEPPANLRTDNWRLQPALTVLGLLAFIAYSSWSAFTPHGYYAGNVGRHYLSPFFSPCVTSKCGAGTTWDVIGWWRFSAALLILPFPLAFRATCYYYRKAYYRSFWMSPPACAVPDAHSSYTGESRWPLLLQNFHRYAFYLAIPFPLILLWEAIKSLNFSNGYGLALGSVILFVNAILLGIYTASCHSCRHLCGGHLKAFSRGPARYWVWRQVSKLNEHHMLLAWISLVFVGVTDIYVRLIASGAFHDPRFF